VAGSCEYGAEPSGSGATDLGTIFTVTINFNHQHEKLSRYTLYVLLGT
jgi:hypothetical protein